MNVPSVDPDDGFANTLSASEIFVQVRPNAASAFRASDNWVITVRERDASCSGGSAVLTLPLIEDPGAPGFDPTDFLGILGCDSPCTLDTDCPPVSPPDACLVGDCDPALGLCEYVPRLCEDDNPCTSNGCDPGSGCVFPPAPGPCDDGDPCTGGDACQAGECVGAPIPGCCNSNGDCDDGLFCNGQETCVGNTCQAGVDPCPGQGCDEGTDTCGGCDENADCDDGLFCNGEETCGGSECQPGAPADCADTNGLTLDCCDEDADQCTHTPLGPIGINRVAVNSGDAARPTDAQYRMVLNVAEPGISPQVSAEMIANAQYRTRFGVLAVVPDCNSNGTDDRQEIACGDAADCNANGFIDTCEISPTSIQIVSAASWRGHGEPIGRDEIGLYTDGCTSGAPIASEPRVGGIIEVRIAVASASGLTSGQCVTLEERTCGDGGNFTAYSGIAIPGCAIDGDELVIKFTPPLENARTYRLCLDPVPACLECACIKVRGLVGDTSSDGWVNALDRSVIVGVWTGSGYSPNTDLDLSGRTNGIDRSIVVGAWTGGGNCAP